MNENQTVSSTEAQTQPVAAPTIEDFMGSEQPKKKSKPRKIQAFEAAPLFGCRAGSQAGEINKALCLAETPMTPAQIVELVNAGGIARVTEGRVEGHLGFWLVDNKRGVGRYLKFDKVSNTYWLAE